MPVSELISKLVNADAARADVQAQTAQRLMQVAMGQRTLQAEARRDAVLDQLSAQQIPYAQKQAALDQPKSEVDVVRAQVQDWNNEYQSNLRVIDAMRANRVDYKYIKPYEDDNNKLRSQIRLGQQETMRLQNDIIKDIGNIASSVRDQATLDAALPLLREKDPTFGMRGQFDRNPDTAEVAWGPKTKATMEMLGARTQTAQQKYANDIRDLQVAEKIRDDDRKKHDSDVREWVLRSTEAMRRENLGSIEEQRRARTEEIKARTARIQRLNDAAAKPAAKAQVSAVQSIIENEPEFKGQKWDSSIGALAQEVADRANELRANAARDGEDLSVNDARRQALDEYKAYVKPQTTGGFSILDRQFGGDSRLSYTRAAPKETPTQKKTTVPETSIAAVTKTGATVEQTPQGKWLLKGPPSTELANAQAALDAATTDEQVDTILKMYASRAKKK